MKKIKEIRPKPSWYRADSSFGPGHQSHRSEYFWAYSKDEAEMKMMYELVRSDQYDYEGSIAVIQAQKLSGLPTLILNRKKDKCLSKIKEARAELKILNSTKACEVK